MKAGFGCDAKIDHCELVLVGYCYLESYITCTSFRSRGVCVCTQLFNRPSNVSAVWRHRLPNAHSFPQSELVCSRELFKFSFNLHQAGLPRTDNSESYLYRVIVNVIFTLMIERSCLFCCLGNVISII